MSTNYSPEQRNKNQRNLILTTTALAGVVAISGVLQGWPVSAFLVIGALVGLVYWVVWKLFVSPSARPMSSNPNHVRRNLLLSKAKSEEVAKRKR